MRKYILLYTSIILLIFVGWNLFTINQPRGGSIGDGNSMPLNSWIMAISSILVAVFGLMVSFQLFKKEKGTKK